MWDFLSGIGSNISSGLTNLNNFAGKLDNLGGVIGGAGALYSAYQQQKNAKKQMKLQQDAFDFNKMLSQREIDRQNRADEDLYQAFRNSSYYRGA
ncbi:hypothetical protein CDQ71_00295 [Campylobacter hyointestinalis subsp. hyointestinalis]|uniref:Uncharacterized protein n=1 Tax=Campylobacter hyointestinalis subsp. hyointestinalis TaxID=91352 RepID=A0A9W5EX10_CAMHY|nr:hypothetical protein [Campylobacter hyointestinalis]PPB58771.1 hypothetical protein CDQ71_00295 [Campylobacter hyointestinalis subsp. hyointestinalis]PPB65693.1 hypothetical protein CDQ75_08870 [Campylobacter hyointestinalis subsp. hyointestinalis]CUU77697.1 Uncharacterised protein [Campylobacter hyointestinalis subsp. hyointestinalis]CUU91274.1 Uncharacterised protein [Campylobacter hyointestinalis subsp. hyointestinalis]